jgi:hypothetical protein
MTNELADPAADNSSVPADTGEQAQNDEQVTEPTGGYTPQERADIDKANAAFAPVIKAVDTFEYIEGWVPSLVMGVRALRDRAKRETGALNYFDPEYRKKFGYLLNDEPIGPWLLDERRRSLLNAVHYLGDDDNLDKFMEWQRTQITEEQRKKWRSLRTLVDYFKQWQSGAVRNHDRRTTDQKEIEQVRTEGHKAEAALLAQVEQARRELVTSTIETTESLSMALDHAGPEKVVEAMLACQAQGFARAVYKLLANRLKEPTA